MNLKQIYKIIFFKKHFKNVKTKNSENLGCFSHVMYIGNI